MRNDPALQGFIDFLEWLNAEAKNARGKMTAKKCCDRAWNAAIDHFAGLVREKLWAVAEKAGAKRKQFDEVDEAEVVETCCVSQCVEVGQPIQGYRPPPPLKVGDPVPGYEHTIRPRKKTRDEIEAEQQQNQKYGPDGTWGAWK
jgi:hypothetical protein